MITSRLAHFTLDEFQHPELVDDACARALDMTREVYGAPLYLTSDARSIEAESALPNHAVPPESSLHVQGRAFDLKWTFGGSADVYRFCKAVYAVCRIFGFEAEIEPRPPGRGESVHMHLGFFTPGHPGQLEL